MRFRHLHPPQEDNDHTDSAESGDWRVLALEVGPPFVVSMIFGFFFAADLYELNGATATTNLDRVIMGLSAALLLCAIVRSTVEPNKKGRT